MSACLIAIYTVLVLNVIQVPYIQSNKERGEKQKCENVFMISQLSRNSLGLFLSSRKCHHVHRFTMKT